MYMLGYLFGFSLLFLLFALFISFIFATIVKPIISIKNNIDYIKKNRK